MSRQPSWSLALGLACVFGSLGCRARTGPSQPDEEAAEAPPPEPTAAEDEGQEIEDNERCEPASPRGQVGKPAYAVVRQRDIGDLEGWRFAPEGAVVAFEEVLELEAEREEVEEEVT